VDDGHSHLHDDKGGAPDAGAPRDSAFGRITQVLNVVGTLLILLMVVAVNADVIGRNVFNHPVPGVIEFLGLAIVAIVFLQMANTLREGRHVSNDLLLQLISRRRPRVEAAFYAVFNLLGAILFGLIVVYVWPYFMQNWTNGYFRGTTGIVQIPIWPFQAALVVGSVAATIQFLELAWRNLRRTLTGNAAGSTST
jgi:TRAP-type C4-dicarboxylate transport system permease small subunit